MAHPDPCHVEPVQTAEDLLDDMLTVGTSLTGAETVGLPTQESYISSQQDVSRPGAQDEKQTELTASQPFRTHEDSVYDVIESVVRQARTCGPDSVAAPLTSPAELGLGSKRPCDTGVGDIVHRKGLCADEEVTEGPCICPVCSRECSAPKYLKLHLLKHENDRQRPLDCDMCGKTFSTHQSMKLHRFTHTGEKPYACKICRKHFRQAGTLKRHMVTHTGDQPHRCPHCPRQFSQRSSLVAHLSLHTEQNPYLCVQCGKNFKTERYMKRHLLYHTDRLPVACELCDKRFRTRLNMRRHMLRMHLLTTKKICKCLTCGAEMQNPGALKNHMAVHNNGRKQYRAYVCETCGRRFQQRSKLKKHKQEKHGGSSELDKQPRVQVQADQVCRVMTKTSGQQRVTTYELIPKDLDQFAHIIFPVTGRPSEQLVTGVRAKRTATKVPSTVQEVGELSTPISQQTLPQALDRETTAAVSSNDQPFKMGGIRTHSVADMVAPSSISAGYSTAASVPITSAGPLVAAGPSPVSGPVMAAGPSTAGGPLQAGGASAVSGPLITAGSSAISGPVIAAGPLSAGGPLVAGGPSGIPGPLIAAGPSAVSGPLIAAGPSPVSGPVIAAGPSAVSGPVIAAGPSAVSGPLIAAGPSAVSGPLIVAGPSAVSGPLIAAGPSAVSGPLIAAGPSAVSGPVIAAGPSAVSGPVIAAGPSVVSGSLIAGGPSAVSGPVIAAGPSAVSGPVIAAGPSVVSGSLIAGGPSAVSGPLIVAGPSAVSGPLIAAGPSAVSGPLITAGPSAVSGPLIAAGPSAVSGPLIAAGPSAVSGPLIAAGPSAVSGPVIAGGPSAVSGPLIAGGPSAVSGPLIAAGPLSAGGPLSTAGPLSARGPLTGVNPFVLNGLADGVTAPVGTPNRSCAFSTVASVPAFAATTSPLTTNILGGHGVSQLGRSTVRTTSTSTATSEPVSETLAALRALAAQEGDDFPVTDFGVSSSGGQYAIEQQQVSLEQEAVESTRSHEMQHLSERHTRTQQSVETNVNSAMEPIDREQQIEQAKSGSDTTGTRVRVESQNQALLSRVLLAGKGRERTLWEGGKITCKTCGQGFPAMSKFQEHLKKFGKVTYWETTEGGGKVMGLRCVSGKKVTRKARKKGSTKKRQGSNLSNRLNEQGLVSGARSTRVLEAGVPNSLQGTQTLSEEHSYQKPYEQGAIVLTASNNTPAFAEATISSNRSDKVPAVGRESMASSAQSSQEQVIIVSSSNSNTTSHISVTGSTPNAERSTEESCGDKTVVFSNSASSNPAQDTGVNRGRPDSRELEPGNVSVENVGCDDDRTKRGRRRTMQVGKGAVCPTCGMQFAYKSSLRTHQFIHSGEKPYPCSVCRKSFRQAGDLQRHLAVHTGERKYTCRICRKGYKQSGDLAAHMMDHTDDIRFSCPVCSKRLKRKCDLRKHMYTHTGFYPFQCDLCGKQFREKAKMLNHKRNKHGAQKIFVCEVCSKQFNHPGCLKNHLRKHTGNKPHVCAVCSKGYVQRGKLVKHMRTHQQTNTQLPQWGVVEEVVLQDAGGVNLMDPGYEDNMLNVFRTIEAAQALTFMPEAVVEIQL